MDGEPKSKIQGWRKMGIGIGGITAISLQDSIDFKIAIIIAIIAITGIVCQCILDYKE